jgi:Transglycosylase-like domain
VLRQAALCALMMVVFAGSVWITAAPDPATAAGRRLTVKQPEILGQIARYQHITWRWERVMSRGLSKSSGTARRVQSAGYRRWVRDLWRRRALHTRRLAQNPPHRQAWLCIHSFERHSTSGWRTNTGNGFYGGLQMDWSFMRLYGPRLLRVKGTADHWTPLEQMWVGERALRAGRGFYPWPNSGRACGLI